MTFRIVSQFGVCAAALISAAGCAVGPGEITETVKKEVSTRAPDKAFYPREAFIYRPEPEKRGRGVRLGGWLESQFSKWARECVGASTTLEYILEKPSGIWGVPPERVPLTSIPPVVYDNADLDGSKELTFPITEYSQNALFSMVFNADPTDDGELTAKSKSMGFLSDAMVTHGTVLPRPGFKAVEWRRTCKQAFEIGGDIGGTWKWADNIINLKSNADFGSESLRSLTSLDGTFESPFFAMWQGNLRNPLDVKRGTFMASTLLWNWYKTHTSQIGKDNWAMKQYRGFALYKRNNATTDESGGYNFDANVKAGFLGVTGNAKSVLDLSFRETSSVYDYGIGIDYTFDGTKSSWSWEFEKLPLISEAVGKAYGNAEVEVISGSGQKLWNREPISITQRVWDLPPALCNRSWTIEAPTGQATAPAGLTIFDAKVGQSEDKSRVACDFVFEYRAEDPTVQARGSTVSLKFDLVDTFSVNANSTTTAYALRIPGKTIDLSRPNFPTVSLLQTGAYRAFAQPTDSGVTARWDIDFTLGTPETIDTIRFADQSMVCNGKAVSITPVQPSTIVIDGRTIYQIRPEVRNVSSPGQRVDCEWKARPQFWFKPNIGELGPSSAVVAVSMRLDDPRPAPAAAPAPAPTQPPEDPPN